MDSSAERIDGEVDRDSSAPASSTGRSAAIEPEASPRYSIAAVSKRTGISCHTLRIWERRYGFPAPERTEAGHRRYRSDQVRILDQVARLYRATDRPVGQLIAELNADGGNAEMEAPSTELVQGQDDAVASLVDLLARGDAEAAEREFARICGGKAPIDLADQVIHPAFVEAGEGWFRHAYPVYKERLITGFLRRKLHALIEAERRSDRPSPGSLLIGTVQGDRHEGGVLLLNLVMELRGWRVLNLGTDLPVREYQAAVGDLMPTALALSFTLSRNIRKRFQELGRISEVPVFVGGRSIVNYQALARSFGLIPLPGPIREAAPELDAHCRSWMATRGGSVEEGTPPTLEPGRERLKSGEDIPAD